MKLLHVFLIVCTTLVASCGGGSGSTTSTTGGGGSAQNPNNLAPVARDDLLITAQNQSIQFDYLSANDSDANSDTLTITSTTNPTNGSLSPNGTNTFVYRPNNNFVGEDSFTYTVSDGQGGQSQAKVTIAVNASIDVTTTRSSLLAGVKAFSFAPTRGFMTAFGPTTVNLSNYKDLNTPMAVAATLGAGRVVALPGLHWLSIDVLAAEDHADMPQFYNNVLKWLSGKNTKDVRILLNSGAQMGNWLSFAGYTQVTKSDDLANNLSNKDVLIAWLGDNPSDATINAVTQFIQKGGSALLVEFGDGFKEHIGWWSASIKNNGGNRVLRKAGIVFGNGWNDTPAPLSISTPQQLSDTVLIDTLASSDKSSLPIKTVVGENLSVAFAGLPNDDTLVARLDKYVLQRLPSIIPSPKTPVSDVLSKAIIKREVHILDGLALNQIKAHRSADLVWGVTPASAPRLASKSVSINGNWSGMQATGMYAPPGEIVTVNVPTALINQGYKIQISGHVDDISNNDSWRRMPSGIARVFDIKQSSVQIASPYGGAIYIDLLEGADATTKRSLGTQTLSISGAIEAPMFILGQTTNAEWLSRIRQNPAPYAELVSERVAISVPSSMIRQLADPEALMSYWNTVVATQDYVGGTESYRTGPDRINFDAQISVGYLHAGYPIQGPFDVESSTNLLDLNILRSTGEWGYFHELGHEMQDQANLWRGYGGNAFTFDGGVEVTVNIFANAALEKMAPLTTPDGWGWSVYPNRVLQQAKLSINDSSNNSFHKKDQYPYYFSLADGFGWDMMRRVLSSYIPDALAKNGQFPISNQEKMDQWLIRWSRLSGYNLVDYFVNYWKLEVSQNAINSVNAMNLPNWLPAVPNIDHFKIAANTSKQLDFRNAGIGLTGTVSFVRVIVGPNHSFNENANGTFTYQPKPGFKGLDEIKVVYRSEAGNEVTSTIFVQVN